MGVLLPIVTYATEYNLLAPLPGGDPKIDIKDGFITYMKQLIPFLLSIAAVLAVVMIVVGGIQYVGSAGNPNMIGDAKDRIQNALLGLLLAAAAYLILNTINPNLVNLQLNVPPIQLPVPSGGAPNPSGSVPNPSGVPAVPTLPVAPHHPLFLKHVYANFR